MRSDLSVRDWPWKFLEKREEDGYLGRSVCFWIQRMSDVPERTEVIMNKKPNGLKRSTRTNKPLIEKKRRDRINACLMELKSMVVDCRDRELVIKPSKLEKADILELTVKYIQNLILHRKPAISAATKPSFYTIGYHTCIAEVSRYFETNSDLNNGDKCQILTRLKEQARLKVGTDPQVGRAAEVDTCPVQNQTLTDANPQEPTRSASASSVVEAYLIQNQTLTGANPQKPTGSASASSVVQAYLIQNQTLADANPQKPTRSASALSVVQAYGVQGQTVTETNLQQAIETAQQEEEYQNETSRRLELAHGAIAENINTCVLESASIVCSNSPLLDSNQSNAKHIQSTDFHNREPHQILYVPQGIVWREDNCKLGPIQPVLVSAENDLIVTGDNEPSLPYVIVDKLSMGRQERICEDKYVTHLTNISTASNCSGCVEKSVGTVADTNKNFVWRPW